MGVGGPHRYPTCCLTVMRPGTTVFLPSVGRDLGSTQLAGVGAFITAGHKAELCGRSLSSPTPSVLGWLPALFPTELGFPGDQWLGLASHPQPPPGHGSR